MKIFRPYVKDVVLLSKCRATVFHAAIKDMIATERIRKGQY